MIEIINQFGGRKNMLFIALFVLSFFLMSSLVKNKKRRFSFSLFASLFVILQLISLFATQVFIGYSFYVHFNLRGITGLTNLFTYHIIGVLLIFIILLILNYNAPKCINKVDLIFKNQFQKSIKKTVVFVTSVLCVGIILLRSEFIADTKSLFVMFQTKKTNFKSVLSSNNMKSYVSPNQIKSVAGKNIIVISLESLEKGLLSKKYSYLTPNLSILKQKWNYIDLKQNEGSNWTSGSLYTYLTGFPAFFGIQANGIFKTVYHSDISSISHVLEKANYSTTYLNGNTNHSGIKEMLNALHFSKIIDVKNVEKTGFESKYGIRDKDLFELAKSEINNLKSLKQPFSLFISTTDTHFPNGIYDSRMENVISEKKSKYEFMVAAVDYMIGDFINYLERENVLENTVIYIFPDHLKMGSTSMFKDTGERGLYVLTNANINSNISKNAYQIDLPKIILDGAKITHNLKFLTDYISGNKADYIKKNILSITEINTNGLQRIGSIPVEKQKISENYESYKKDNTRFIAHAGGKIKEYIYTNSKEALDLSYEKGFRLFELDIIETSDHKFVAAHDWKYWSEITNYRGEIPVSKKQFLNLKIHNTLTALDMEGINNWFSNHKDAILITDKINNPIKFSEKFIDKTRLIMELFDMQSVKKGLRSGILSAMPSQRVVNAISKDEIKALAKLGVKNIAISRNFINENKELLLEFKKYNIKPFAYHINSVPGIDEDYMAKYEMDYIHGIYADDWNFVKK